jgi:hypothetical protein
MKNISSKIPKYLIHKEFTINDIVINDMMIDSGIEPTYENFLNYKKYNQETRKKGMEFLNKITKKYGEPNDRT